MAVEDKYADELMSDEELDHVAGGEFPETWDDMVFLNKLNGSCKLYDWNTVYSGDANAFNRVIEGAWRSVGIEARLDTMNDNEYYLNGKQITRNQAYEHANQVVGSK